VISTSIKIIDSVAQLVEQPDRRTDTFNVWVPLTEKQDVISTSVKIMIP
jgi:hypothetical protein